MIRGAAVIMIEQPPSVVFAAVSDISRMGEWSPECVGGRWIEPATGPAVGARFEGHNVAKLGPIPIKKWTTASEVTAFVPGELFEFTTEDHTRWRYELVEVDGNTRVAETFQHPPHEGFQKFLYTKLFDRHKALNAGMKRTLERLKQALESPTSPTR